MPTRLVALGDSTVEGLMDEGPHGAYVGWADRYAQRLAIREPGLLYANLGVRGQTSHEVRATQLDRALSMRPDVALLVAGCISVSRSPPPASTTVVTPPGSTTVCSDGRPPPCR